MDEDEEEEEEEGEEEEYEGDEEDEGGEFDEEEDEEDSEQEEEEEDEEEEDDEMVDASDADDEDEEDEDEEMGSEDADEDEGQMSGGDYSSVLSTPSDAAVDVLRSQRHSVQTMSDDDGKKVPFPTPTGGATKVKWSARGRTPVGVGAGRSAPASRRFHFGRTPPPEPKRKLSACGRTRVSSSLPYSRRRTRRCRTSIWMNRTAALRTLTRWTGGSCSCPSSRDPRSRWNRTSTTWRPSWRGAIATCSGLRTNACRST